MNPSGTVVPMVTPTHGTRRTVDTDALRRFTRSLVDAGAHGLFPGSSIGEFPSLTAAQNRRVVETVADAADDRTTVLAGCCDTSVDDVLENIEAAADAGSDAAVVVSPYYLTTTQGGLDRFFLAVADESPLPVLLYNIPQLTGNELSVDLVTSLADHETIVGLKDTSGRLTYHHRIIKATPDEFAVFQGATELATASLDVGADGLIAGPANVFPKAMVALYEAYDRGDRDAVRRLMGTVVMPLVSATSDLPTAAAMKHLVGVAGPEIGEPLPPLPQLTDEERAALSSSYRDVAARTDEPVVEQ
jgi:4-hydroxy-tetrahydrodipicolinate synthase